MIKKVAIGTTALALSTASVATLAATKDKHQLGDSGGSSLTQIASAIYAQISAAYTASNARLQQVDSYLSSFISSSTSPVSSLASTALEPGAQLNSATAVQPATMRQVPSEVQLANSTGTATRLLSTTPYTAMNLTGANPVSMMVYPNSQKAYLPWYKIAIDNTPTGSLLTDYNKVTPSNTPLSYKYNMTSGVHASDSFENILPPYPLPGTAYAKTLADNNDYFNFMHYFAPMGGSYSMTPQPPSMKTPADTARGYAEFLSLSNQPLAPNLGAALSQYVVGGKVSKDNTKKLAGVLQGDDYKTYLLQERQYNASRSMVNGLLSQVWTERAPVKSKNMTQVVTGILASDPTAAKYFNADGSASPLQMENYIRLHRVQDPNWYKKMSTASPAAIAREQLYVSAQMLAAQQQAHLDSQRLLMATLLSSQNYVNGTLKTNLSISERTLQTDLCKALGGAGTGVCANISQPGSKGK
jgi:hypothetical protein